MNLSSSSSSPTSSFYKKKSIKYYIYCLLIILLIDLSTYVHAFEQNCPPLQLINGRSRYRFRGRNARFNCMRGFQLVGAKYASCMNGKWDADLPICVSKFFIFFNKKKSVRSFVCYTTHILLTKKSRRKSFQKDAKINIILSNSRVNRNDN